MTLMFWSRFSFGCNKRFLTGIWITSIAVLLERSRCRRNTWSRPQLSIGSVFKDLSINVMPSQDITHASILKSLHLRDNVLFLKHTLSAGFPSKWQKLQWVLLAFSADSVPLLIALNMYVLPKASIAIMQQHNSILMHLVCASHAGARLSASILEAQRPFQMIITGTSRRH